VSPTFFIAPTKGSSQPFNPNIIFIGTVTRSDTSLWRVWIKIPRFFEDDEFGPIFVSSPALPEVGMKVACTFMEGKSETLVVLGPLSSSSSRYVSIKKIATGDFPSNPVVTPVVMDDTTGALYRWTGTDWVKLIDEGSSKLILPLSIGGPISTMTGLARLYAPFDMEIIKISASLGTTSSSGDVVFDVKKNGSSLYAVLGDKPTIAAGDYYAPTSTLQTTSVLEDDYITLDVVQEGTGATDAVILIHYR
jgi:hypothetical protein